MEISEALENGLNGGAILFCGAGFSADCLNFGDIKIGTGHPLLELLNARLGYEFSDLQTAADEFIAEIGNFELQKLLKERYQVKNVPASIVDVFKYPWDRIYTTNYDNAISQALHMLGKRHQRINNLEKINSVPQTAGTWVVHLHGSVETWDAYDFEESCVLGAQSYYRNDTAKRWKSELENDFNKCSNFVFIGFSARDYYLNKVFYNATASRDKVFFY